MFLTIKNVNKDIKSKENFGGNHFHNILRVFCILANFFFTARQAIHNCYLKDVIY